MTVANPAPSTESRSMGLDLLRAACILYLVGYWHLMPYTQALPNWSNWFTEGLKYAALATFVLCSGYLLAGHRVALTPEGLWSFYRRRLLRIYPLYAVAAILLGPIGLASLSQVVDALLSVSMFRPPALPTLWFVAMIMVLYLIAPLLIRIGDKPGLAILATGGILLLLLAQHLLVAPIDLRIAMYLPVFALGILYRHQPALRAFLERHRWPLLGLALLLLPLSRLGNEVSVGGAMLVVPLLLASSAALLIFSDPVARRLSAPAIAFLAYASFGLYLFHRPVYKAAIALYFPSQGWAQVLYLLGIGLPVGILLGYGVQRGYDRLLAHWSAKAS